MLAVAQPVAFHPTQDPISSTDLCHAIGANENATAAVAYAVRTANTSANGHGVAHEVAHTLDQAQGQAVMQPYILAIRGRGDGRDLEARQDGTANALLTPNGGRDGMGVGAVAVPVGVTLHGTDGTAQVASYTEVSSSLRSRIPSGVENSTTTAVMQPVCYERHDQDGRVKEITVAPTQHAKQDNGCDLPIVMQPVTYDFFNITAPVNKQNRNPGDPCHTLARSNAEHAVVMRPTDMSPVAGTLAANGGGLNRPAGNANELDFCVPVSMQVRRLTPVECARLQGFPDDYLMQVEWRGKTPPPDGPMYKALGNSWAVPVVHWIGKRIKEQLA
jgi:DNA (cytosine-5)-methyltransferase 1